MRHLRFAARPPQWNRTKSRRRCVGYGEGNVSWMPRTKSTIRQARLCLFGLHNRRLRVYRDSLLIRLFWHRNWCNVQCVHVDGTKSQSPAVRSFTGDASTFTFVCPPRTCSLPEPPRRASRYWVEERAWSATRTAGPAQKWRSTWHPSSKRKRC